MSSRRSRSGGTAITNTLQPVEEVLAEAALAHRALEVAVGRGDHAHVDASSRASTPTGRTSPVSSTRSSRTCSAGDISPISSRKSVPPSRLLEQPALVRDGAGERAAHVAEQLGLEQALGAGRRS